MKLYASDHSYILQPNNIEDLMREVKYKTPIESADSIRKSKSHLLLSGLLVACGLIAYLTVPGVQNWINHAVEVLVSNDRERTEIWVSSFGLLGPVLLVIAMVGQIFLVVVPTTALLVVSILAYGPVWGSAIGLVAIYAASSVGYFIGRGFGAVTVEKVLGSKARNRATVFLEKYGFWAIFITRLNPFLSNDVVSLVSGMVKINYWKFTFASLAGIAPLILFIAVLGDNTGNMLYLLLLFSSGILVLFCGYIFITKKQFRMVRLFGLRGTFKRRFS